MKFIKISIIILSLIAVSVGSALAQTETATSSRINAIKNKIEKPFEKNDIRNKAIETQKENMERRKENVEQKKDNIEQRRDMRASTTAQIKQIREVKHEDIKDIRASTTLMFKAMKDEKKEIVKSMQLRTFEIRKNNLAKELSLTIKNLENIDSRIKARLASSTANGKDTGEANLALITAESKLLIAKNNVSNFASLTYATSTVTADSSIEVSLDKPRQVGDETIKSVKDARDSFKIVLTSITKILERKIDANVKVEATIN